MSEPKRPWLLRALALAIAVGLWVGVSFEDRDAVREKTVEATVTFDKPQDLMILSGVEPIRVRVRGRDRDVVSLAPHMVQVEVQLRQREGGVVEVPLSLADVDLPSDRDLTVRSVEPNKLRLAVDKEAQSTLPLRFSFTGEPAAGARVIADRVTIEPPQVTVTGPSQVIGTLETLDLTPINLDGHALSFEEVVSVIPPAPMVQVLRSPRVTVRVPMALEDDPRRRE